MNKMKQTALSLLPFICSLWRDGLTVDNFTVYFDSNTSFVYSTNKIHNQGKFSGALFSWNRLELVGNQFIMQSRSWEFYQTQCVKYLRTMDEKGGKHTFVSCSMQDWKVLSQFRKISHRVFVGRGNGTLVASFCLEESCRKSWVNLCGWVSQMLTYSSLVCNFI